MDPVTTNRTNVVLSHEDAADLPAERIAIYPVDADPDELGELEPQAGFETVWLPDAGERAAILNGAPVHLRVWGNGHPPVSLNAGEPPEDGDLKAMLERAHVNRAAGRFWGLISEAWIEGNEPPQVERVLELWDQALAETKDVAIASDELHRNGNGNRPPSSG